MPLIVKRMVVQCMLSMLKNINIAELSNTQRGTDGFGSTGK